MLLQPRTFELLQLPNKGSQRPRHHRQQQQQQPPPASGFQFFEQTNRLRQTRKQALRAAKMLLLHQAGGVKVGEVVRYTVTYTPSLDRVLPTPTSLHVKVKNTSAIPLRAAWVHGPYTLHVGVYPSTFNPHCKVENPERDGVPQYEPMVKAGGSWTAALLIPEGIRENLATLGTHDDSRRKDDKSVTWIVEIASQILFSTSASVGFEVLIGRDERSVEFGFAAAASVGHSGPGVLRENPTEEERRVARRKGNAQTAGVYSKAIKLVVEDTETLWDKPPMPSWDKQEQQAAGPSIAKGQTPSNKHGQPRKRKNIHLVIVTHGLHSNLGADMLFLKESIDATVKQARLEAKKRKRQYQHTKKTDEGKEHHDQSDKQSTVQTSTAPLSGGQDDIDLAHPDDSDDDEEETIVRGFNGNAVRTGNGIQYLGKRLAKYILRFTYPDQPFLPVKRKFSRTITDSFKREDQKTKRDGVPAHHHSSIHHPDDGDTAGDLPYKFTSISFVGHSLGGLIQTYAIAYIHKHSPGFFDQIKPVNFICMASPMLGLSNENPLYVKFALDFGLVGRTGRDLGLSWNPTHAKSGWNTMINGLGVAPKDGSTDKKEDPSAKPLLRILPTGPAHHVLRMFRNRTVYSNVVNDGIVPLRTSCLLFLDWRGLGKVEKARRENGLIGTMAEWGWAELTGANASTISPNVLAEQYGDDEDEDEDADGKPIGEGGRGTTVPLPAEDETTQDNKHSSSRLSYEDRPPSRRGTDGSIPRGQEEHHEKGMLDTLMDFFRPTAPPREKTPPLRNNKTTKALRRAQTINPESAEADEAPDQTGERSITQNPTIRPHLPHVPTGQTRSRGSSKGKQVEGKADSGAGEELHAPPKTSIFESAGDILHPPLPSRQWITDPSTRARAIFHDRVYHPEDIPPPPLKPKHSGPLSRAGTSDPAKLQNSPAHQGQPHEIGSMRVEEKIARAYHRDLSWRKVLVRLEPDAHNNMIVRRMFANAYGWPVVKHLCDTHFANTYSAKTRDEDEPSGERARPLDAPIDGQIGEQVKGQTAKSPVEINDHSGEYREDRDELADLDAAKQGLAGSYSSLRSIRSGESHQSSTVWDDSYLEGSDGDDSDAVDDRNFVQRLINPLSKPPPVRTQLNLGTSTDSSPSVPLVASPASIGPMNAQLGLAPKSPLSPGHGQTLSGQNHGVAVPAQSITQGKSRADIAISSAQSTFDSGDLDNPDILRQSLEHPDTI